MLRMADEEPDSVQGWRVVAGTHVTMAVTFGSAYAFSALFPGLSAEFGASRAEIALVFSLAAFVFYTLGAIAGPLADRWSTRGLVAIGLTALALGYLAASQAHSLPMLYLAYASVGLGLGLSYVPAISAVQSWFVQKRARASGIATAGIGLGTLLIPLLIGHLVPPLGWRNCFLLLATLAIVLGLPATALIGRRAGAVGQPTATISPGAAWSTPGFRMFYCVLVLASFCIFIPYVHLVPAARDLGLSLETGTMLIALIGIGTLFGRFVVAGLGDRIGTVRLLAILTATVAASFGIWAMATNLAMLVAFTLLFGAAYGGCVGLYPAVAADLFGTRTIGAMLGYLYTGVAIAALLGPPLAGLVFDRTGTYLGPIAVSAGASALAAFLTLKLRR